MHRPTVGLIALALLAGAAGLHFYRPEEIALFAALVRVGFLMVVLWLALPALKQTQNRLLVGGILGGLLALALAPRLFAYILPVTGVLLVLVWLKPRLEGFFRTPSRRQPPPSRPPESTSEPLATSLAERPAASPARRPPPRGIRILDSKFRDEK